MPQFMTYPPVRPAPLTRRARAQRGLRIAQAALCLVLLSTCGHLAASAYGIIGAVGLGIFLSILGGAAAALYLAAPRIPNARLHDTLPGLLDACVSGLFAVFAIAAGGSLASVNLCSDTSVFVFGFYYSYKAPAGICAASALAIVSAFLLFASYVATCTLAALDMRDGHGPCSGGRAGPYVSGPAGGLPAQRQAAAGGVMAAGEAAA